MDVVEEPAQRACWPRRCWAKPGHRKRARWQSALQEVQERAIESQQRDLRAQIAEAERRGDYAGLAVLTQQKLELDRALRQLHSHKASETVGVGIA